MKNVLQLTDNTNPLESIHGPYTPEDIRDNELVTAKVVFGNKVIEAKVWRVSPLGIELISSDLDAPKGAELQIDLKLGSQQTLLDGILVEMSENHKKQAVHYIRLVTKSTQKNESEDRRFSSRWMCSPDFFPTGIASNPVRFNDFIYFKVADISFGGIKLIASLRNKFLISGVTLECLMNFPMISQVNMKIKIRNVRIENIDGKDCLAVGATYETNSDITNKVISNYLLQFSSAESLAEIKEAGFLSESISETVNFTYVKTKDEFDDVLKLRFEAYLEAGKVSDGKTYQDMTDKYDAKSRIVIGKLKGKIVCSARIIFHQLGDKLEQEQFVDWSEDLPRQDEVVEIMRACTKPGFRGSDLLLGMFKFMAITVAQTKKNWIVICATNEMVPFYEKIGFKKINKSYNHIALNNIEHHVMIANFLDGMSGKSVNPIYWNIVWADSVNFMSQYEMIEADPMMQVRISIYKWFKPLAKLMARKKFEKKQKRVMNKKATP